jgi:hypothetical protein
VRPMPLGRLASYLVKRVMREFLLKLFRASVWIEYRTIGFQEDDAAGAWALPNNLLAKECDSEARLAFCASERPLGGDFVSSIPKENKKSRKRQNDVKKTSKRRKSK